MRVGFCQFAPEFGRKRKNLEAARNLLEGVKADLMVLPEFFATGYQFVDRKEAEFLAEPKDGPTVSWAMALAHGAGVFVCGGFPERDGGKVFNSAFLVGPDGLVGIYRKVHLFSREKDCFDVGEDGFLVFDIGIAKVGVMICFDWIFPESMRVLALSGAQVVCHPANLVLPYCQEAMRIRCLENGVFAVTANRIGTEARIEGESLTFTGRSQVTSVNGEVIEQADVDFVGVKVIEIDPKKALSKKITEQNDLLKDRKPDLYLKLTEK